MRKLMTLIFLPLLILSGCADPYNNIGEREFVQVGWNKARVWAAVAETYQYNFLVANSEGKMEIKYGVLPREEVIKELDKMLTNIDAVLSYRNKEDRQYVDFFGLQKFFEDQEKVLKLTRNRLMAHELYSKFEEMTRGHSNSYHHDPYSSSGYGDYGYSAGSERELAKNNPDIKTRGYSYKVYVPLDMVDLFKFRMEKFETAKKEGKLKPIDEGRYLVKRTFAKKRQEPGKDDPNEFVWLPRVLSLEVEFFKIINEEKVRDNSPDLAEGWRTVDGKREAHPCFVLFFINGNGVMVLDTNRQGETGFGLPDHVMMVGGLRSSEEVFSSQQLLTAIFEVEEGKKIERKKPELKEIAVEFAPVGVPVDLWEKAPTPDGWRVPFAYKDDLGINFRLALKWEKPHLQSENDPPKLYRKLESVDKRWHNGKGGMSIGNVKEHFRPKPPYDVDLIKAEVLTVESERRVLFIMKDGSEERATIVPGSNKYIEDEPFAVEYDEADIRWRLEKSKDSKVFDKRRRMAKMNSYH